MSNTTIVGRARFKDGKLVFPSKEKNTKYRNNDKQNTPATALQRSNLSYQNNALESPTNEEEPTLDLGKWKQENKDDWIQIRQKVEKNRKIK